MSNLESLLAHQLTSIGLTGFEREYRWAAERVGTGRGLRQRLADARLKDWRFDFAWPEYKLAVEIEGGAWIEGRHNRGQGFHDDLVKYGTAQVHGWTVYRCDGQLVRSGEALNRIQQLLELMGAWEDVA